jgi:Mrp family chromosome partitioning ATPase
MDTSLLLPEKPGRWDGSWQYRRDCINLLRTEFDYALIDCSSLKKSSDLLSVAPFVDGVILVIEANRTRREQIQHAERTIEKARGKLLGHVLNKRTYTIPAWFYRRL